MRFVGATGWLAAVFQRLSNSVHNPLLTSYTTAELLAILDSAPERLSPNALLRAVFQDTILPTTATIGGRPRSRTSRRARRSTSAFWAASRRFCRACRPR